jgi:cell division GTPase FtsZ
MSSLRDYMDDMTRERDKAQSDLAALREYTASLITDRDRWRSIAERAMDLLEEANKVLATIQEAIKND